MNEIEVQREILNQVIKKTIGRIKELQKQLEVEKQERKELGVYEDCGSFYQDAVIKTEAVISELVSQKISLEKWRKKLKYSLSENN
jgi:hypothetical protein